MEEKRRHPRIKEKLPLKIHTKYTIISTQTKNISCSGAYCAVDKTIPVMSKVRVAMTIPFSKNDKVLSKKIMCDGVVVRCEAPREDEPQLGWNAAVMFTNISKNQKDTIATYINYQLANLKEGILKNG